MAFGLRLRSEERAQLPLCPERWTLANVELVSGQFTPTKAAALATAVQKRGAAEEAYQMVVCA